MSRAQIHQSMSVAVSGFDASVAARPDGRGGEEAPLRVLLVEDSEHDEANVLLALKRAGYTVTSRRVQTAPDMHAALDQASWHVVLTDHDMPRFSSLAAIRLLEERGDVTPIIVVSGNIGEEAVAMAMRAGAYDYVSKNDLSRLGSAIERAMRDAAERRERMRAEAARKESEERFALAVRGSRDGIWDRSFSTNHIYYSERFEEMLGFGARELDGVDVFAQLVHDEDRERVALMLREHLAQRSTFDVELRLATKQGDSRWFCARGQALWSDDGTPVRMAGSLSDLSARKQTEAELKEQIAVIRAQQEDIRVLSTPIIEVWEGVLTVPVLGRLDHDRASNMMDALLDAVVRTGSRHAIIDLTGVASLDSDAAQHLLRIVRSVQLLGARGIIVGLQPSVANAIISLGVDLPSVEVFSNLRQALLQCTGGDTRRKQRPPGGFKASRRSRTS